MPTLEEIIRKHVLKNAYDFGRANPGSVAGKVIADYPEAKNDMKSTMQKIVEIIGEVSSLSKSDIEEQMSNFTYVKKKEEKKEIELPEAESGKVITRFPPEPSGYLHIGHAKAANLNFGGAKAYNGHMILRFDDTNPEKESEEFVGAIRSDLKWMGIEWKTESYTSDNLDAIYRTAEELIRKGKAFVSTANRAELSDSRTNSKPLPERNDSPQKNLERWNKMLSGEYKPGEALLLFKGDLESQNTVMRDPAMARIIDSPHYKQGTKYRVWPGYDLAVVFMDHKEGVTHPMRSKEYELRDELYYALFDALGWKRPRMVPFSRLAIKNAPISKRLLSPLVKEGKVMGWDDPRLPTLAGLRRRGILPEAIRRFVLSFGLSKVESEPDWEALLSENRKLLDPQADHYFFVENPVKILVKGLKAQKVKLKLHPKQDKGFRELETTDTLFISRADADALEDGEVFRLKDLCNAKLLKKGKTLEAEFAGDELVPKKLQWVPEERIECEILKPGDLLDENGEYNPKSLERIKGYCEASCKGLKAGDIIQFERFGFCRLDESGEKLVFVFSC